MGSAAAPNPSLEPTRYGARLSSNVSNDQRRRVDCYQCFRLRTPRIALDPCDAFV
jgi:hypothetical protein